MALKKKGASVLLSEQNIHFARLVADRAYVLEKGQIRYSGSMEALFADEALRAELADNNLQFSSANSINWGRLAPQIVYYFSAYTDLVKAGTIKNGNPINFTVPTGIPISRAICSCFLRSM